MAPKREPALQMTPPMDSSTTTTALTLTPQARAADAAGRHIYIAVPWTPLGGGMYKVADYLIQSQEPGEITDCP